ncbi:MULTISPECIES: low affinity iron permease family protein [unclassified Sphingomonas]|uniref:low affinity iron permease family protein n=1 Tax=unclassified Sphingomonas TaxID=196159 RepID=UPI002269BBAA|nr:MULTISPECIES: low affinity iron permease family protein [unclassified Sphingomonas]
MDVAGTLDRVFTRIASSIAAFAGQPGAFVLAVASIVIWGVTGPIFGYSDTWQLVVNTATTIITFLMVFLIQNSSNRDGAAMQAKLDELIRAVEGARSGFIGIEHMTDHQIEELRSALERECSDRDQSAERTVASLAERL